MARWNLFLSTLLVLTSPLTGQMTPGLQAEPETQKVWSEFEKTVWSATPEKWSRMHPEIPCESFHGTIWASGADRQWTQRCTEGSRETAAHWTFYIFSSQLPLLTHLEQFDVSTDALPGDALKQVQQSLQTRLTTRYGPGEDHSPTNPRARAVAWPNYVTWRKGDLEIQLNLSEFDPRRNEGRLSVLARHRPLLDALAEDDRLKKVDSRAYLSQAGSPIDEELSRELVAEFPDISTMLVHQQPPPDPAQMRAAVQQMQDQLRAARAAGQMGPRAAIVALPQSNWTPQQFHDSLVRLLTAAKTAESERQPVLLLAADRLAWRLPTAIANDRSDVDHWNQWREQLAKLGVTYKKSELVPVADDGPYRGDLLRQVWTNYGHSIWGERAFLLLLNQGFDASPDCEAGSDSFRIVIQQGEPFLNQHPQSPYRPEVQLSLAQAYETWWSLSQAQSGREDSDVEPANYQSGAGIALQKSIQYYKQLLQASPESDDAAYARRQLPRLLLSADTGQRRFYCTVGD
jgi:hypothetical protein